MGEVDGASVEEILAALSGAPLGEKVDLLLKMVHELIRQNSVFVAEIEKMQSRINTHQHPQMWSYNDDSTNTDWGVYPQKVSQHGVKI